MSKYLVTMARKNFLLTGRNLRADPRLKVGSDPTASVGLRGKENFSKVIIYNLSAQGDIHSVLTKESLSATYSHPTHLFWLIPEGGVIVQMHKIKKEEKD